MGIPKFLKAFKRKDYIDDTEFKIVPSEDSFDEEEEELPQKKRITLPTVNLVIIGGIIGALLFGSYGYTYFSAKDNDVVVQSEDGTIITKLTANELADYIAENYGEEMAEQMLAVATADEITKQLQSMNLADILSEEQIMQILTAFTGGETTEDPNTGAVVPSGISEKDLQALKDMIGNIQIDSDMITDLTYDYIMELVSKNLNQMILETDITAISTLEEALKQMKENNKSDIEKTIQDFDAEIDKLRGELQDAQDKLTTYTDDQIKELRTTIEALMKENKDLASGESKEIKESLEQALKELEEGTIAGNKAEQDAINSAILNTDTWVYNIPIPAGSTSYTISDAAIHQTSDITISYAQTSGFAVKDYALSDGQIVITFTQALGSDITISSVHIQNDYTEPTK